MDAREQLAEYLSNASDDYTTHRAAAEAALSRAAYCAYCSDGDGTECECDWDTEEQRQEHRGDAAIHAQLALAAAGAMQAVAALLTQQRA